MTDPNNPWPPSSWEQPPTHPQSGPPAGGYQTGYQGGGYPGGGYPAPRTTNGLAIASMVVSLCALFVCGPVGIVGAIMGHKAKAQLRERPEDGDGFATAGIVVGWIGFALGIIGTLIFVGIFLAALNEAGNSTSSY
jgi:hypothetical protein